MRSALYLPTLLLASPLLAMPVGLVNGDFQASGNNSDPAGWTVSETNAGNVSSVYVYSGTSNVLAFWGAGASTRQTFSTTEITADTHGFFTIGFDSGWRGFNLPAASGFVVEFAIVNATDGTVLGSATYQFPLPAAAITNTYTPVASGNRVSISYDSSQVGLEGDAIALRITGTGSPNQGGSNFLNTAWIDNIEVSAAPREPAAHWSFDPPDRTAESYGRSTLALAESGGASAWVTRAGFGEALANGVNSRYLTATRQAALDPADGDFSLSLWTRRTSQDGGVAGLLDALSSSAASGWQLFYQANGTLRLRLDDTLGNTINADTAASQITLNSWRNLIVTVDRKSRRARFFMDGAELAPLGGVDIGVLTGPITPDQDLFIGGFNGSDAAKGQLDDVAFFKRVLTAEEIAAISANGGRPVLSVFPPVVLLPAVAFSLPDGSLLRENERLALTSEPGVSIRYTLDGSEPTSDSPLYTGELDLPETTTVRSRVSDGSRLGPVSSATFLRIPENPPNVLVIVADDLGFNDLGAYGAVSVATPRIDQLSYQGQRFTQFTTTGPGDAASQYALLTGRLAKRGNLPAAVSPGLGGIDSREWTLAESFRKSGYHTAFIGVWQLGDTPGSRPGDQGFSLFHGFPWALTADPAPPLLENRTIQSPQPANLMDALVERTENEIAARADQPFFIVFQPPSLPLAGSSLLGTRGHWIEALDAATGRLLDQLDASGVAGETLVVFLSDGGAVRSSGTFPTGSNGQLRDGNGSTWEGGVRGPLITRWPGVIPAGDNFAVIWLPDIHRTLIEIIDGYQATDRPLDGTPRPDVLLGARQRPDDATTIYLHRHTGVSHELQALRQGPWKLHLSTLAADPGNTAPGTAPLLFDLLVDPSERINRASSNTSKLAQLQQSATAHQATFSSLVPQLPPARSGFLGPVSSTAARLTETTATFLFSRPADSLDDHYSVQLSADLDVWTDLPIAPYIIRITAGPNATETVELTVPLELLAAPSPRHFVRLKNVRP